MTTLRKEPTCGLCKQQGHTKRSCPIERDARWAAECARREAARVEEAKRASVKWAADQARKREQAERAAAHARQTLIIYLERPDLDATIMSEVQGPDVDESTPYRVELPTVVGVVSVEISVVSKSFLHAVLQFSSRADLDLWVDSGGMVTGSVEEACMVVHRDGPSPYDVQQLQSLILSLTAYGDLKRQKAEGPLMLVRLLDVDDEKPGDAVLALHRLKMELDVAKRDRDTYKQKYDDSQEDYKALEKEKDAAEKELESTVSALNSAAHAMRPGIHDPCPACGKVGFHDFPCPVAELLSAAE